MCSCAPPLGELLDVEERPLPSAYPAGSCGVPYQAGHIVHAALAPAKARILRKVFRGSRCARPVSRH